MLEIYLFFINLMSKLIESHKIEQLIHKEPLFCDFNIKLNMSWFKIYKFTSCTRKIFLMYKRSEINTVIFRGKKIELQLLANEVLSETIGNVKIRRGRRCNGIVAI